MNDPQTPIAAFLTRADRPDSDSRIPIQGRALSIGKASDNDVVVADDKTVSRHHCVIWNKRGEMSLEDLGSTNGTYLDGKKIAEPVDLPIGSRITVGRTQLFVVPEEPDYDRQSLVDSSYATRDSVIIPVTGVFEQRTEAFLVVDIVKSTELLQLRDDLLLIKLVAGLGKILERFLEKEERPFLKCTGDGYLSRFGSADSALVAAQGLVDGLERYFPEEVRIAVALHWGTARFREEEGLIGKHVHAVFSLEGLRGEDDKISQYLELPGRRGLVLMTGAFRDRLSEGYRARSDSVGEYFLKGLEGRETVYRWLGE